MPVFHTKTIESILEPVAQQVNIFIFQCFNCYIYRIITNSIMFPKMSWIFLTWNGERRMKIEGDRFSIKGIH